jgi:putative toxin-antitoxin system antitoxin component (TIGR02293 family)
MTPESAMPEFVVSLSRLDHADIQRGLPFSNLEQIARDSCIEVDTLCDIVIYSKSPRRRRQTQKRLSIDESDKLAWVAQTYLQAMCKFGDRERAAQWLLAPHAQFDGRAPFTLLRTSVGMRAVTDLVEASNKVDVAE